MRIHSLLASHQFSSVFSDVYAESIAKCIQENDSANVIIASCSPKELECIDCTSGIPDCSIVPKCNDCTSHPHGCGILLCCARVIKRIWHLLHRCFVRKGG